MKGESVQSGEIDRGEGWDGRGESMEIERIERGWECTTRE